MNSFLKRKNVIPGGMLLIILLCTYPLTLLSERARRPEPKVNYIPNPSPTHVEKDYVELINIHTIPTEIIKKITLTHLLFLVGDQKGNIFILDGYRQIHKFDKDYKYIKTFGKTGNGKGEFTKGAGANEIWVSKKGYIHAADVAGRKMITFDTDGNHTDDLLFPNSREISISGGFIPAITAGGDFYARDSIGSTLNVYNIHDKPLRVHDRLLNQNDSNRCLLKRNFGDMDTHFWVRFLPVNTFYDLIPGDRLLVYLTQGSTVYIFDKNKQVKTFDLWPKDALEIYKHKIEMNSKRRNPRSQWRILMFENFFTDKDDETLFYLGNRADSDEKNIRRLLYRFNLEGKLIKVFYVNSRVRFKAKINNRFYALCEKGICVFEEKEMKHDAETLN